MLVAKVRCPVCENAFIAVQGTRAEPEINNTTCACMYSSMVDLGQYLSAVFAKVDAFDFEFADEVEFVRA